MPASPDFVHTVAAVVPVYRGETTLEQLLSEMEPFFEVGTTPAGHKWQVVEVVLVHDHGPDRSADVIRRLAAEHPQVTPVWLSRNFGQHAATLAGIGSTSSSWVCTLDEDGQHHPADIALLLDAAVADQLPLVYGKHRDRAPHAGWRNFTSSAAKRTAQLIAGADLTSFTSFRLILGSHARSIAAYCGPRTYLDVALTWAIGSSGSVEVTSRPEWRPGSGYTLSRLLSHFWTLVLSGGTRPLRAISTIGAFSALAGFAGAASVIFRAATSGYNVAGWASFMATILVIGGLLLLAIGVVAEYIGVLLRAAQGRPTYVVVDDPNFGPLRRTESP